MENLLKKQLINFFVGNCGGIKYFLYLCSRNRVRQLVAMVHTTPLNGRAPNASALRSDYHSVSSPPDKINKALHSSVGHRKINEKNVFDFFVSEACFCENP